MKLVYSTKINKYNINDFSPDIIDIEVYDKKQTYDVLIKIVGGLFLKFKEKFNEIDFKENEQYINNKNIINQFEKVMSCIRFEINDKKDMFKDNNDNLNLLMNISESINLTREFKKLLDDYLKVMKIDYIQIEIDESEVEMNNDVIDFNNYVNADISIVNDNILPNKIIKLFSINITSNN